MRVSPENASPENASFDFHRPLRPEVMNVTPYFHLVFEELYILPI
jgi:hypothetical protein